MSKQVSSTVPPCGLSQGRQANKHPHVLHRNSIWEKSLKWKGAVAIMLSIQSCSAKVVLFSTVYSNIFLNT